MKTAICTADLRREVLCTKCKKLLEDGKISELDVKVSRILEKLSKQFYLGDVDFRKSIDLEKATVIVCTGRIGALIGKRGQVVSELTKELGKKVRIIEKSKDEKKMAQDLLGDVRVEAVNTIFKDSGQEKKILLSKSDESKLLGSKDEIEKAISGLLSNSKVTIEFG